VNRYWGGGGGWVGAPPQTTAISRDFKKSTAMCKVHNVGLRYIKREKDFYHHFFNLPPSPSLLFLIGHNL
jgi:hypothetical protein